MGQLLLVKIAKIVIYDNARLNGVGITRTKLGYLHAADRNEVTLTNSGNKKKLRSDLFYRLINFSEICT